MNMYIYEHYTYIFIYINIACKASLLTTAGSKRGHGNHLRWDPQTWLGQKRFGFEKGVGSADFVEFSCRAVRNCPPKNSEDDIPETNMFFDGHLFKPHKLV